MKIGYSSLGCPDWSIEKIADVLARNGYDGVELRGRGRQHIDPSFSEKEREEVKKIFASHHIEIMGITSYIEFSNKEDSHNSIEKLKEYINLAADIGAQYVRVFGGGITKDVSLEECYGFMAESLQKCAEYASNFAVTIAIETHDDFSLSERVKTLVESVNHPNFKSLWDVHHPFRFGENPEKTLNNLINTLCYLHIKDAFRRQDGIEQLVSLGAGAIPVKDIIRLLKDRGFNGYLIVEWEKKPQHPELIDSEFAIPQHIFKIREYLKR